MNVCVVVRVSVVCVFIGTASAGLLESPQGAGAHVNDGSCWTGLLLHLPPSSFLHLLSPCPSPVPSSLLSVPLSDGGADKPTSSPGT